MSIFHRIKSAIITAVTFLGAAAITTAVAYPDALSNVLLTVKDFIGSLGLPASISFFAFLVLNEVVRDLINRYKIKKAIQEDEIAGSTLATRRAKDIELY